MKKIKQGSFIGGTGIYLFSNVLNGVIPFILLPVLTRYLSPEEYGEVAMFQTLLGALGAFVGMTFVGAANRKFYDYNVNKTDLAEFIGSCVQLTLISGVVVFFILYAFQNQLSEWLSLKPAYVLFAALVSSSTVIVSLRLGQWQVNKQAIKFGMLQISQSLMNMSLSLVFVVVLLLGVAGRIEAQVIASVVFLFIALYLLKKDSLLAIFTWRKDFVIEILKFGIPLMPHIAGIFLISSVDRFIINKEMGLAGAGIYMVAVQLTAAISIVFDAINKAYVPWLFEKLKSNKYEEKKTIVKLTYVWFLLIILGVLIAFLIGPWLVVVIAGENYREAGAVVGWLALGQGFSGMYLMVTNYIFYSKKTGLLSFASIFTGLLNVTLLICLIPFLGLQGAAIAFSISMGIRFILTWWIAQKRHPMPWFSFNRIESL